MGLLDWFKNRYSNLKYAKMLNGYSPMFSQFGNNIYASDVVQQAISCIVMEMKKLNPQHVRDINSDAEPVADSNIQKLLNQPNERMTQSDFLEKIIWQLFLNYNSFIIPTYRILNDTKIYTGLYPVQPYQVDFLQDASEKLFVKFTFANNYEVTLRYEDVIHIKYRFSVNEFMGGNEFGQPDNAALLKTLELNETLLQGVGKALKSSFAINGVIKYNTLLDGGKMDTAIAELEEHLRNNESGILPLDLKGEFIPLQNKIQLVDSTTLKFIDEKILRHFGVPLPILTGDYTKAQYEAFYQKTLEPLILSIQQAFTKTLFTDREKSFGNKIIFYPHELIFMTTDQKISLFDILVDSGACYKNELRTAFGMQPLKELAGQIAMSSNKENAVNNSEGPNDQPDQSSQTEENDQIDQSNDKDELRYNPYHDPKSGKFLPKPGGSGVATSPGGSSGPGKNGTYADVTSKKNVDKSTAEVRKNATNEYKPFEKEKSVDINKVKERGGCSTADAKKCVDLSESVYSKAAAAEPKITSDVVSSVEANGGKMYGLDFRMKQSTSMAGKIAADVKNKEAASFEEAAAGIKDSVRYTALFETSNFTQGYNNVKSEMESKGYKETRCKNFFTKYKKGESEQKAVQCTFTNDEGFTFEFQFHTYDTQGAKEVNHPLYEEARNATTKEARKKELSEAMTTISSYSPIPKGVYDIKEHK